MRIAQVAPVIEKVPPAKYGGIERVVSELTEELVRRGHEVTLFASGDSKTAATLVAPYPTSLREAKFGDLFGSNPYTLLNIGSAYQRQYEFDIIHDHCEYRSIPTANLSQVPVLMTIHCNIDPPRKKLYETLSNPYYVSISKSQASLSPSIKWIGTVYNGLTMDDFTFSDIPDKYLLYVGRFSSNKAPHLAIKVAKMLNMPLILAAKLDNCDIPYFEKFIKPELSKTIRWIGEVNTQKRNKLMSKALCMLHTAVWNEPFGLTLIEAMACGCPVIAFHKGAIPEIIKDGKTGYIVSSLLQMVKAVQSIAVIKRDVCRSHAIANFGVQKMADEYERIYQMILERRDITKTFRVIAQNHIYQKKKKAYTVLSSASSLKLRKL